MGILLWVDVHRVVPKAFDEVLRGDLPDADVVDSREEGKLVLLGEKRLGCFVKQLFYVSDQKRDSFLLV